ncbi:MAG: T9SS type A sorting domain-containing protein [Saprospiraceae bacterium]
MKKIITITLILFCIFQNGISQEESRLKRYIKSFKSANDTGYVKNIESDYDYNINGDTSSIITKTYDVYDDVLESWEGMFYEYDSNQLLTTKSHQRYNIDVDLWITVSWIDYKYNSNGCLMDENIIQNVGSTLSTNNSYLRDSLCQLKSKTTKRKYLSSGDTLVFTDFTERTYYSDGISYEEKFYKDATGAFIGALRHQTVYIYNENSDIIEYQEIFFSGSGPTQTNAAKFLTFYNELNNIETIEHYKSYGDETIYNIHKRKHFYNEYDENEFLIKTKEEEYQYYTFPNGIVEFSKKILDFQNSCKGILEEKYILREIYEDRYKEEYIYEGINECLDLESLDLDMLVFPNPTSGYVEIISSIFQSGNTEILVYSIDGKVLLEKMEINRFTSSLDLSFLPNGFYILQLSNGDHFVKEKIVIVK